MQFDYTARRTYTTHATISFLDTISSNLGIGQATNGLLLNSRFSSKDYRLGWRKERIALK